MQIIKIKVKGFLDSLTFRGYTTVANFVNVYFPLKIIILAKREREVTTKIAIACNRCYLLFYFVYIIFALCHSCQIQVLQISCRTRHYSRPKFLRCLYDGVHNSFVVNCFQRFFTFFCSVYFVNFYEAKNNRVYIIKVV